MIKRLFTLSLACLGAAASAQTVLGKVTRVEGIVTISDGATMGAAAPGTVLTEGNRVVTANSGAARLTMDNGCVINLEPNQSLTIGAGMSCRELLAAVQSVSKSAGVSGIGGGAMLAGGALLAAGLAGSGSGSGGNTPGSGGNTPGSGGAIPVVPSSGQ